MLVDKKESRVQSRKMSMNSLKSGDDEGSRKGTSSRKSRIRANSKSEKYEMSPEARNQKSSKELINQSSEKLPLMSRKPSVT